MKKLYYYRRKTRNNWRAFTLIMLVTSALFYLFLIQAERILTSRACETYEYCDLTDQEINALFEADMRNEQSLTDKQIKILIGRRDHETNNQ